MAELPRKEWDRIRARRSPADIKYLFALLQRDGVIEITDKRIWEGTEIPSIPADDPIFTEGVIITTPIKP